MRASLVADNSSNAEKPHQALKHRPILEAPVTVIEGIIDFATAANSMTNKRPVQFRNVTISQAARIANAFLHQPSDVPQILAQVTVPK